MTDWSRVPVPQNYGDLYRHYGKPDGTPQERANFKRDFLTRHSLKLADGSTTTVTTHVAMIPHLEAIAAAAGKHIHSCAGSYVYRDVRGGTHLSLHSWGLAIDLNSDQFPLSSPQRQDQALIDAFHRRGFWYGGDFHHRKDPMHWQLAGDF